MRPPDSHPSPPPPRQLTSGAQIPEWIPAIQEPFFGICPGFPRPPNSLLFGGPPTTQLEETIKETLTATVDFSGRLLTPSPPTVPHHTLPVPLTWYCTFRSVCHPQLSNTPTKASEPLNRAILRASFEKS